MPRTHQRGDILLQNYIKRITTDPVLVLTIPPFDIDHQKLQTYIMFFFNFMVISRSFLDILIIFIISCPPFLNAHHASAGIPPYVTIYGVLHRSGK